MKSRGVFVLMMLHWACSSGCSVLSLGGDIACEVDLACPGTAPFCVEGRCTTLPAPL